MTCRISSCPLKYISQGLLDLLESSTPVGVQGWKVSGWRGKTLVKTPPPSRAVPLDGTRRTVSKSGSDSATRLTGGSSGFQGGQSLRCLVRVCGLWVLFKPSQATDAPTIRSWMDYPRLQGCGVGLGVPLKQRARLSAPVVRDNGGTEIGLQGTWQH